MDSTADDTYPGKSFADLQQQAYPTIAPLIVERSAEEVWRVAGDEPPPSGIRIRNPAFDVTPHDLIAGWITERGIVFPPFDELR